MLKVIHGDYRDHVDTLNRVDTIFADPPDNIDLGYDEYDDNMLGSEYHQYLMSLVRNCLKLANTVYISFNAKWMVNMGAIVYQLAERNWATDIKARFLIQGFTFGQHNKHDHGNNFRPILRLMHPDAPLFPDAIRTESERMKMGDKRANPAGRVPGDVWFSDFLEYSRVVGNAKQRRAWHPTQLHEGLVEDCLLMSTPKGGTVLDPFCGTGTTLRVCKANGWSCTTIDISENYCSRVAEEHEIPRKGEGMWVKS